MAEIIYRGNGNFGSFSILQLNSDLVPHAHPEGQIVFALDSHIDDIIFVNDEPVTLDSRTAVFANPMEKHSHTLRSDEGDYLVLYFERAWLIDMFGDRPRNQSFMENRIDISEALAELITCFRAAATNRAAPEETDLWVEKIAVELRQFAVPADQNRGSSNAPLAIDKVEQAMACMTHNLLIHRDINLIAREIGVSRPQLFKLFRTHLKTTPNISWNALRMDYAKERLLASDISVETLAGEIGFSEAANFSRFFKHHAGFNPSQFRLAKDRDLVS
ncbi:AraC-type DNA-binding protein [Parasphingorhabdus marina DSM 22363]|uniref:AraC-type DNA-binding protein n=1 Tax=Parasphingorhabdus marina DSM 22363 TaxID=1123272 RepID=A0A1N6HSX7_9SPHN|nr:AraC family transcriptional regulator [Parasphingorhabdus marina]SIO22830.1 AraC-type DNA-binding protein [Parasphingorhabdus marina DSM 22363]